MSAKDLFWFQTFTLSTYFLWPVPVEKYLAISLRCLGRPLRLFLEGGSLFLALHIAVLQAKTTYNNFGANLDDLTDALTSTIIYSFSFFGSVYFMWSRAKLLRLVSFISEIYQDRSTDGLTYVRADEVTTKAKRMSQVWIIACIVGVITWAMYPIVIGQRILPVRCWYPFNEKQPIVYELIYLIQTFAQLQLAVVFGGSGSFYMAVIIILCGQFDVLFCNLKNLYYSALFLKNDSKQIEKLYLAFDMSNEEVDQYLYSKEYKTDSVHILARTKHAEINKNRNLDDCLRISLKQCIKHHQSILIACKFLEDFFSTFCLIKSLQGTIQLCLLLFVSFHTTTSFVRALSLGQYLLLTLMELMLFTLFGHYLKMHSVRVGEALLRTPWYLESAAIKNDILIILQNTLRPITITAGRFFIMDVDRLKNVIMSAFSYLTLLQSLRAK